MAEKDPISYKLLCNACLCVGLELNHITDVMLKRFYLETLNEIPMVNIINITPVLCLDCEALLRRAIAFKKLIKDSYQALLKYTDEYLQDSFLSAVSRTPRLQVKTNDAVTIAPDEMLVKDELKMDWESERASPAPNTPEFPPATPLPASLEIKPENESVLSTIKNPQTDTQQVYMKDDVKIEGDREIEESFANEDRDYETDLLQIVTRKKRKSKNKKLLRAKEKRDKKKKKLKAKETKDQNLKMRCIDLSYDEMILERDREISKDTYVNSEYKCENCIMGFKYYKSYKTHLTKRHAQSIGEYTCPICKTVFASVDSFTSHYKRHMRRYECSICGKRTMDAKVMQQHYYSTHEISLKEYKCGVCGFTTNSIDTHRYHKDSHKARLQCKECDKTFRHRAGLLNHRLAVHEYKNVFPCNVCDKVFKWRTSLRRHQAIHENKKPTAVAYCALCGINFKTMCSYQRHMKNSLKHITKDQLRFICDHCNKKFADKTKLRNHIEEKHLHKTFQCSICLKMSRNRVGLEQHVRNVHKGRPNNKMCHHCGKIFPTKVQLESHIRSHTGERPFICEYCPTTFSQQSNLYKHNRQVHLNMKSKRYVPCKKRTDEPPPDIPLQVAPSLPIYSETGYLNAEL